MSATVTTLPRPRVLTPRERQQAQILAELNEEKASLCDPRKQQALIAFFQMNAKFLRSIAHDRST